MLSEGKNEKTEPNDEANDTLCGSFDLYGKTKRRAAFFLSEMDRVVPWSTLYALIEPIYPKAGNGRPPVGLERMLRIYFLQNWFNLSEPEVEEVIYDSVYMCELAGIDLGREGAPDETTVCKFRQLLEEHELRKLLISCTAECPPMCR